MKKERKANQRNKESKRLRESGDQKKNEKKERFKKKNNKELKVGGRQK